MGWFFFRTLPSLDLNIKINYSCVIGRFFLYTSFFLYIQSLPFSPPKMSSNRHEGNWMAACITIQPDLDSITPPCYTAFIKLILFSRFCFLSQPRKEVQDQVLLWMRTGVKDNTFSVPLRSHGFGHWGEEELPHRDVTNWRAIEVDHLNFWNIHSTPPWCAPFWCAMSSSVFFFFVGFRCDTPEQ